MNPAPKIYQAILAIKSELEAVKRSHVNSQQKFKYRGIDDLYNAISPLEAKHGVFTIPTVLEYRHSEKKTASGGSQIHAILKVQYRFMASDGSSVDVVVVSEGLDSGDKASNKALSFAHKYALTQIYAVRTEDQVDPDSESPQISTSQNTVTSRPYQATGTRVMQRFGSPSPNAPDNPLNRKQSDFIDQPPFPYKRDAE